MSTCSCYPACILKYPSPILYPSINIVKSYPSINIVNLEEGLSEDGGWSRQMCQYWPSAGSSNSPSVQIIISSSMAIHLERKTVTSQNPGLIGSLWDDPDLNNMAQISITCAFFLKISFFGTWHPSSQWSPIYPPCMSWHTRVLYCKGERLFVGSGSTKPLLIFMMSILRCKRAVTKRSLSKQGESLVFPLSPLFGFSLQRCS